MSTHHRARHVGAYLRFLHLMSAVKLLPGMGDLGTNELALFEEILLAWSKQTPLTVRQAIAIERLGSPATLHKRLSHLRHIKLVDVQFAPGDRRAKLLVPTAKGIGYAEQVGQAISGSLEEAV